MTRVAPLGNWITNFFSMFLCVLSNILDYFLQHFAILSVLSFHFLYGSEISTFLAVWAFFFSQTVLMGQRECPPCGRQRTRLCVCGFRNTDLEARGGWGRPNIRAKAGVLKKLSLDGLAKLSQLRYSWLRFGLTSAGYHGLGVNERTWSQRKAGEPANTQLISQSMMKKYPWG